jgi:hypothetical protein
MCIRLILTLFILLPGLALADFSTQQLHSIRIHAFGVCSHLLAYYNPGQDANDERHAERYRTHQQALRALLANEPEGELSAEVARMEEQIAALEGLPPGQPGDYSLWLLPLLKAHARLDAVAAERYAAGPSAKPEMVTLNRLSLDVERLLLIYQTRAFSLLTVFVVELDENTIAQLDAEVLRGFADMHEQWPGRSDKLLQLQRQYDFIRPRLLAYTQGWVPGSAAYYLGKVSRELALFEAQ